MVTPQGPLKHVRITYPGLPYINLATLQGRPKIPTIDCEVVGSLYKRDHGPMSHDIALLHAGSYNAADFLKISPDLPVKGDKVNVIGYPGVVTQKWLLIHEGLVQNVESSRRATDTMFPAQRMTITSGFVESVGTMISYKLSTIPGMSGAPVLHNDDAVGIYLPSLSIINKRDPYWPGDWKS